MNNLADFVVQKGGGLVMIAGPQFDPLAYRGTALAPLVPVDLATAIVPDPRQAITEGFSIRPTTDGLSEPNMQLGDTPAETAEIWQKLPPVYWLLEGAAERIGRSGGRASDAAQPRRPTAAGDHPAAHWCRHGSV